jgi:hypothetical protein
MEDQKNQRVTTARSTVKVSNRVPSIFPAVALQICTLATNWKIWEIMKRKALMVRRTRDGKLAVVL